MRRKLYTIIEPAEEGDKLSAAYDYMMMAAIALTTEAILKIFGLISKYGFKQRGVVRWF